MAVSTGLIVTAGGLVILDDVLSNRFSAGKALRNVVATVVGAYVTAGLDRAAPGLGTGLAVILVVAVAYNNGPSIAKRILSEG
jgi:hypothetical protein